MHKLLFLLALIPGLAFGANQVNATLSEALGVSHNTVITDPIVQTAEVKEIVLTANNSVVLRDAVSWRSMGKLQFEILQLAVKLGKDEPIYLILDTPGGSVSAGEMFIETLKGIKQPVHAIVIFAASMGFQITQATNRRYILESGTLMSHRATVGIQGQLNGELESRLAYYKKSVTSMELRSAKRVGMSLEDYQSRIINEWWEHGYNAVKTNVADEVVTVKCSDGLLRGTIIQQVFSFFGGSREFRFSRCPLISAPLGSVEKIVYNTEEEDNYFNLLFSDKRGFINNFITNGAYTK